MIASRSSPWTRSNSNPSHDHAGRQPGEVIGQGRLQTYWFVEQGAIQRGGRRGSDMFDGDQKPAIAGVSGFLRHWSYIYLQEMRLLNLSFMSIMANQERVSKGDALERRHSHGRNGIATALGTPVQLRDLSRR